MTDDLQSSAQPTSQQQTQEQESSNMPHATITQEQRIINTSKVRKGSRRTSQSLHEAVYSSFL